MTHTGTETSTPVDDAHRAILDAGLVVRKEVLGDDYVNAALTKNAGTDGEALQKYVSEYLWGSVWTRPGLDRRSRSLLNLGMLVALFYASVLIFVFVSTPAGAKLGARLRTYWYKK